MRIAPEGSSRRLTVTAANAGDLLRALDVTDTMQDGRLTITGHLRRRRAGSSVAWHRRIAGFPHRRAAGLGKLLQAMTLYGLVDVLRGSGLAFTELVAPFTLSDGLLELADARAFSPSLGLTAKGRLDIDDATVDLQGTIVPAYFFNSLAGQRAAGRPAVQPGARRRPVRRELYAAWQAGRSGVTVNPLAALTPGFLRGLFGIF